MKGGIFPSGNSFTFSQGTCALLSKKSNLFRRQKEFSIKPRGTFLNLALVKLAPRACYLNFMIAKACLLS